MLAIDSAGPVLGVAVRTAAGGGHSARFTGVRGQAERLLPLIAEMLAAADLRPADLRVIAANVGPGSFTGIRLGLAVAEGLALATGAATFGIDAFTLAAACTEPDGQARGVLLDSKRQDVFCAVIGGNLRPVRPGQMVDRAAIAGFFAVDLALCGDSMGLLPDHPQRAARIEPAMRLAELVGDGAHDDVARALRPLYLRPPDAMPAQDGGRLRR